MTATTRSSPASAVSTTGIPARRSRYYLTIRGPILDLATNSLVGEFLEERVVKIDRGKVTNFKFDLRPREAMVSVEVKRADSSVPRAQVAVRGVPGSTRFCPECLRASVIEFMGSTAGMLMTSAERIGDCDGYESCIRHLLHDM